MSIPLSSQCHFPLEVEIEDQETVTIPFDVIGAANNDLSSTSQCVAEVSIDFEHTVIGDLIINLISPAGQVVNLIGPVGPSGTTQFITWDISFVPCATEPDPHTLLNPVWNNLQNWELFNTYTGSYHPYSGCLEDFDTGPVNGTWNVEITDAQQFDVGIIHSISITFCDITGLDCDLCEPQAGTLPDTIIYVCEGTNYTLEAIPPVYSGPHPHPALYDYTYLLTRNDTLLQIDENLNLNGYPDGIYYVFGLSYLISGVGSLPIPSGEVTIDSLEILLYGQSPPFCGEISNYFELKILPPDTFTISETICNGNPVIINGITYHNAGQFTTPLENIHGCDSIIIIHIDEIAAEIILPDPDELDCEIPQVLIDASGSLTDENGVFTWSTSNGNIISNPDSNAIYVNQEGTYFLTLQNGLCSDTQSVVVSGNAPIIFEPLEDTYYLDCIEKTAIIDALEGTTYTTVEWNGPNSFHSEELKPEVMRAGIYQLTVFQGDSCHKFFNFNVLDDTLSATISITGNAKLDCNKDSILVIASADKEVINFTWIDPDSVVIVTDSLWIDYPGVFSIITETPEGCITKRNFTVQSDRVLPEVRLAGDTLTCKVTKTSLSVQVEGNIRSYKWTGPNSFSSTEMAPVVEEAGWYYVTVTGRNWCVIDDSLFIFLDTLKPVTHTADTSLSCIDSSTALVVQSEPPAFIVNWHGPNGFQSSEFNPVVRDTGVYYVFVESENGCFNLDSLYVSFDPRKPQIEILEPAPLSCSTDSVLLFANADINSHFIWYDPSGNPYTGHDYYASDTGMYKLQAFFSENGCDTWDSIRVEIIENAPFADIKTSLPLQCPDQTITLIASGNEDNSTLGFAWSTEDGNILSGGDQQHMQSDTEGLYYLQVVDFSTGCTTRDTFLLESVTPYDIDLDLTVVSPSCMDYNNGEILIDQAHGGYPPYAYSIDGTYFNNKTHYQYLETGYYNLLVKDSLGCQDTADILLNAEGGITISLPESIEIRLGETAHLIPMISTHQDSISFVQWTPSNHLSCTDCLFTEANPTHTTLYGITIIDHKGCESFNDIEVIVNREKDIYIPNAFSANGDDINETLYIISTVAVEEIEQFSIYNRWGNLVFENRDFLPNVVSEGWDGTFKGQELRPQVLVYMIKYRLVDGTIRIDHGDITLLR